jgi:hypothetical protein
MALGISLMLLLISILSPVFFTPLLWGINYFRFLPSFALLIFTGFFFLAIYSSKTAFPRWMSPLAEFMDRRPSLFLALNISIFITSAIILHVRVPILGDSFYLIRNYENTLNGTHSLHLGREPLATYYFYAVMNVLGARKYPEILDSFLKGELAVGSGFIILTFLIVRELFQTSRGRLLAFVWLLSGKYLQLFFGYVEIYAPVLLGLAAFLLVVVLYLRGRLNVLFVILAFIALAFTHFLALILIPAMIYLLHIEQQRSGWRKVLFIVAGGAIAEVTVILIFGTNFTTYFPTERGSHYLGLTQGGSMTDGSDASAVRCHRIELGL